MNEGTFSNVFESDIKRSVIKNDLKSVMMKNLNLSENKFDSYIQNLDCIVNKDLKAGALFTQEDLDLLTLFFYSLQCYDLGFPSLPESDCSDEDFNKCSQHPEKDISLVCLNPECPLKRYCNSCKKNHVKKCSRPLMEMNPNQIINEEFYKQYMDFDKISALDNIKELDNFGDLMKERMSCEIDIIIKHWKNELTTLTHENILQYAEKSLKKKHQSFKSKLILILYSMKKLIFR